MNKPWFLTSNSLQHLGVSFGKGGFLTADQQACGVVRSAGPCEGASITSHFTSSLLRDCSKLCCNCIYTAKKKQAQAPLVHCSRGRSSLREFCTLHNCLWIRPQEGMQSQRKLPLIYPVRWQGVCQGCAEGRIPRPWAFVRVSLSLPGPWKVRRIPTTHNLIVD